MGELNFSELLFLTRCGDMKARDALYDYFYQFIRCMTKKYHYLNDGLEDEDITQEAMLCFDHALYAYREDMKTKLSTYIGLCTIRCIQSEVRRNKKLKEACEYEISLDSQIAYTNKKKFEEVIADSRATYKPDSAYKMNNLEKVVFQLIKDGYRKDEISTILQLDKKAVYNIVYRLLVKLRRAASEK